MRFIWRTARKDLLRMWREPLALVAWIGIPLFIGVMMAVLFGRGDVKPHGLLLIADEDDTMLSRMVPSAFTQDKLGEMFTVEKVKQGEGRARMEEGKASALVVIPKGFGDAVLSGAKCKLVVVKNPAQQIMPGIVEQAAKLLAEAGFYVQALAGQELQALRGGRPSDAAIAAMSVKMTRAGDGLARWLTPAKIEVGVEVVQEKKPAPAMNMATLMFPGMLMMGMLFTASGLSGDWWEEKQMGTLRRALVGPHGAGAVLAGKVLAFALLAAAVAGVGLGLGKGLMDMALPRPMWTLGWVVLSACGAYLAFLLLQSLATQRRAAEILVNLVLMPLCMVGGCFFPFEMMPKGLAAVGRMTPNGMVMVVMRETMEAGSAGQWWLAAGVAAAVMAVLFGLCARQARARFVF